MFTKPIQNCELSPEESYTMKYQHHTPCGFCLYVKPLDNIKTEIKPNPLLYTKKTEDENIADILIMIY